MHTKWSYVKSSILKQCFMAIFGTSRHSCQSAIVVKQPFVYIDRESQEDTLSEGIILREYLKIGCQ